MKETRDKRYQMRLPIWLALAVAFGVLIGAYQIDHRSKNEEVAESVQKLQEVLSSIDNDYVDSINIDDLVEKSIKDMLLQLDPHTSYFTVDQVKEMNEQLRGSYDGIGIEFDIFQDTVTVIKAIDGGPSARAGIRPGDKIVEANGETLVKPELSIHSVASQLKGKRGTSVNLLIKRYGQKKLLSIEVERGRIPQPTVTASYQVNDQVGYIKIERFGSQTYREFKSALNRLQKKGIDKLVVDLQGNGGGYMTAAEEIADEFISKNKVIVSQKGKRPEYSSIFRATGNGDFEKQSVIVLIDEYSASASEIVAGALQDNDRALLVGRRSYGKGLVQLSIPLEDGSELRLTIARYYTPSGRCIQKPYVDGGDVNYAHDLSDRYAHGEFFSADSIHFNDSLKYLTATGRTVYGGGGIMPDVFVPLDTLMNSESFAQLVEHRVLQELALGYYLEHKVTLSKWSFKEFVRSFDVPKSLYQRVRNTAKRRNLDVSDDNRTVKLIKTYLKAQIARNVWGEDEYYQVYNPIGNKTFVRSLDLFDKAALIAQR